MTAHSEMPPHLATSPLQRWRHQDIGLQLRAARPAEAGTTAAPVGRAVQQKMMIGSAGPALSSAVAPAAALPCRCALDASSTAHCSPQQAHEHGQVELGGLALVDLVDLDGRRRPAAFSSTLNGPRGHVAFGSGRHPVWLRTAFANAVWLTPDL